MSFLKEVMPFNNTLFLSVPFNVLLLSFVVKIFNLVFSQQKLNQIIQEKKK